MKKFLVMLMAIIMAMISIVPAVGTNVGMAQVADLSAADKDMMYEVGYKLRCRKATMKRGVRKHAMLKRVALLPLTILIGTASAESAEKREDLKGEINAAKEAVRSSYKEIAPETARPNEVEKLLFRLRQINALLDVLYDIEDAAWDAKQENKKALADKEAALQNPRKSSTWRELSTKTAESVLEYKDSKKGRLELEVERKTIERNLKNIVQHGNAFASAVAQRGLSNIRASEKAKKELPLDRMRMATPLKEKARKDSFSLFSFGKEAVLKEYLPLIERICAYKPAGDDEERSPEEDTKMLQDARDAVKELLELLKRQDLGPIEVSEDDGHANRLGVSVLSDAYGISPVDTHATRAWISIEHGLIESFSPHWKVFATKEDVAKKIIERYQDNLYVHIGLRGVRVLFKNGRNPIFRVLFASASHQKDEKYVLADEKLMKVHELINYCGLTEEEALKLPISGPEWWKIRANMARPYTKPLMTKDGEVVYLHDGLCVSDVTKKYKHKKAFVVGGKNVFRIAYDYVSEQILGDGAIGYLVGMENDAAQDTGFGLKGMGCSFESAIAYALKKKGLKQLPILPDGRDPKNYKFVFGEGCWKFDKLGYKSYEEYAKRMDELALRYPGINQVYVLREADDLEEEEKRRQLTRSLLQQILDLTDDEALKLTEATIKKLNRMKTLRGMFSVMAELGAPADRRSNLAKLIYACPGLLLNEHIQAAYQEKWETIKNDAMGCRLTTKGQYPYIMQDPVALVQVWLLGYNPNDPEIGVLKNGYISLNGVEPGKLVVCVRFPANALTARVRMCDPQVDAFWTCGNIAILSVHDDILIVQDGDVDGDEMFIGYDQTMVKLVIRMKKTLKPPVIIFEHGGKGKKTAPETKRNLDVAMFKALASAKRYDSVGLYANLARDCAYLAMRDYKKESLRNKWLDYMNLASTGAILAIDQVKGNSVDEELIKKLEKIYHEVKKQMDYKHPYTQQYLKDVKSSECLPINREIGTDNIAWHIDHAVGSFKLDTEGYKENNGALSEALFGSGRKTGVRRSPVHNKFLDELRENYFQDKDHEKEDDTVFTAIRKGEPVKLQQLLILFWRNCCALAFRTEGKTVNAKQESYREVVRQAAFDWACGSRWIAGEKSTVAPAGYEFTTEEKQASVVWRSVFEALEFDKRSNNVGPQQKGRFAKFVLQVFAVDMLQNLEGYDLRIEDFFDWGATREEFEPFEEAISEEYETEEAPLNEEEPPLDDCKFYICGDISPELLEEMGA